MGNGRRSAFAFLIANIYLPLPSVSPCQMYYPHANEGKRHARAQRMKHEASPLPRFVLSKNERVNNKNLWRGILGGGLYVKPKSIDRGNRPTLRGGSFIPLGTNVCLFWLIKFHWLPGMWVWENDGGEQTKQYCRYGRMICVWGHWGAGANCSNLILKNIFYWMNILLCLIQFYSMHIQINTHNQLLHCTSYSNLFVIIILLIK